MKRLLLLLFIALSATTAFSQILRPSIPFIKRAASDPACTLKGQIYYNTGTDKYRKCTVVGTPAGTFIDWGEGGGVVVTTTTSDGTADTLLKTSSTGKVADASGLTNTGTGLFTATPTNNFDAAITTSYSGAGFNTLIIIGNGAMNWYTSAGVSPVQSNYNNTNGRQFLTGVATVTPLSAEGGVAPTANIFDVRLNGTTTGVGGFDRMGAVFGRNGGPVVSAAAIVPTGNIFHVTGTTTITSVTATNINPGTQITIVFDGILTFTDGSNLKLSG
jgi:hypothetical protein